MSKAVAVLSSNEGVTGTITFVQQGHPGSTTVTGSVTGLKSGHQYDLIVHAFGDITHGWISTGPPFHPFGNIIAVGNGIAPVNILDHQIPITSIVGRAIVVHGHRDDIGKGGDEQSKIDGNAGPGIAWGVIGLQG